MKEKLSKIWEKYDVYIVLAMYATLFTLAHFDIPHGFFKRWY